MISITQTKRYVSLMGQRMTVSLCCISKGQSNPLEISGGRSKLSLLIFVPPELSLMRIHYLNGILKVERRRTAGREREKYATKNSLVRACKKYGLDSLLYLEFTCTHIRYIYYCCLLLMSDVRVYMTAMCKVLELQ